MSGTARADIAPSALDGARVISADEVARIVGGTTVGGDSRALRGLDAVRDAKPDQVTFLADEASAAAWAESNAGAALVSRSLIERGLIVAEPDGGGRCLIIVDDAEDAMIDLLEFFAPPPPQPAVGIHPSATVDPDVLLGEGCRIGPHAVVGPRCRLGAGVILHAGVCLYADVSVGAGTVIHANTVVRERCTIGARVLLHQNVSIGADGFGFRPRKDGRGLRKVPQLGTVIIEDDVEIGPASCVDRAKFGATVVGAGTKIDNLCQIGHNCRVGRSCVMAGCSGLAGSVVLGDGVQIGGGCCIADHRSVGAGARIGGMSGVHSDIPAGATYVGMPAGEAGAVLRQYAALRRLPDWLRKVAKESGRSTR